MARAIDGTKATKEVMEYSRKLHEAGNVDAAGYVMWAASIVDKQPTIDPVKHGWWIDLEVENSTGKIFGCSVCNRTHNPNRKDVKIGRAKEKPDYCPNCGARMDGE